MAFFRSIYLGPRFFYLFLTVAAVLTAGFFMPLLFPIGQFLILVSVVLLAVDIAILFSKNQAIVAVRKLPRLFSLGDDNQVEIELQSHFMFKMKVEVIDELPFQLQERSFSLKRQIHANKREIIRYSLRPTIRGQYSFGNIHCFAQSSIGLVERRLTSRTSQDIPVYPSVIQMKKYELVSFASMTNQAGVKRIRRLGHSYEFEKIKAYTRGDDLRSINWKATSRRSSLMVNQYEDERSQPVYSIIDKGRIMNMPFAGLSLLDYSINTSLVIANTTLHRHDKAGLITFSKGIDHTIIADKGRLQLKRILEALYHQKETEYESNFELLYLHLQRRLIGRSLIFLYTSFESYQGFRRVLPILRRINRQHLLVVMFFENTEISDYGHRPAESLEDIYVQSMAQKFMQDRSRIRQEMANYGIQSILSRPEELSINTINKYLEIKSRGML